MSQSIRSIATYGIASFIVLLSFLGMIYPILHPEIYSEVIMNGHLIPMVQHHVEPLQCMNIGQMIVDPSTLTDSCGKFIV